MSKQRITLEDVARESGVSTMTVSRVINNTGRISSATRRHVQEVAERLGYRPNRAARTLVTNRTMMVAFVVPDITNPYFAEILQGVEDVFWEAGYNVLLANTNETPAREQSVLEQLEDATVDGVISCSSRLPDDALIDLIQHHHAVVTTNRRVPQELASIVIGRHPIGYRVREAARFLHQQGRRRIGYIGLIRSVASVDTDGVIADLAAEGIEIRPEWCSLCHPTWQGGYQSSRQLLCDYPELDAVIGGNDLVALGTMRAALELGHSIPDDLALIGGDDILMASQVTPALTTFRISKYQIGEMAARLLLLRMQGDMSYREFLYEEKLIVRGTT